jgi:hypothetical protein
MNARGAAAQKAEAERKSGGDPAARAIANAKAFAEVAAANTARDAKLMAESEKRIQRQDMQEKALQRDAKEAVSRAKDAASKIQVTGVGKAVGTSTGSAFGPLGSIVGGMIGSAAEKKAVTGMQRAAGEAAMSSMGMTGKADTSKASPDVEGSAPEGARVERVERVIAGASPKGALVERDRGEKLTTGGFNVVAAPRTGINMPVRTSAMTPTAPIGSSVAAPANIQYSAPAPAPADNTPLLIAGGLLAAKLIFF